MGNIEHQEGHQDDDHVNTWFPGITKLLIFVHKCFF